MNNKSFSDNFNIILMWNKIACNQILLKKSQEKVRFIQ